MNTKPTRGAPKGNTNAKKPKKARRVLIQTRISSEAVGLLWDNFKTHGNIGRALDHAICKTWPKVILPCCEQWEEHTKTGGALIDKQKDGTWSISGCGQCYVVNGVKFCPFCGSLVTPPNA